jgi:hypothetical protein
LTRFSALPVLAYVKYAALQFSKNTPTDSLERVLQETLARPVLGWVVALAWASTARQRTKNFLVLFFKKEPLALACL